MRAMLALLLAGPASAALAPVSLKIPALTGVVLKPVGGATQVTGEAAMQVPLMAQYLEQRPDYPLRGLTDGETVILAPAALKPGRLYPAAMSSSDGTAFRVMNLDALAAAQVFELVRKGQDDSAFADLKARFDGGRGVETVEIAGVPQTRFDRPELASTAARIVHGMLSEGANPVAYWLPSGETKSGAVPRLTAGSSRLSSDWSRNDDRLQVEYSNSPEGTIAFLTLVTDPGAPALFDTRGDGHVPFAAGQDRLARRQAGLIKNARFREVAENRVWIEDEDAATSYVFERKHGTVEFRRISPEGDLVTRFNGRRPTLKLPKGRKTREAPKPSSEPVALKSAPAGVRPAAAAFVSAARRLLGDVEGAAAFASWEPMDPKQETERVDRARAWMREDAEGFALFWSYEGPEGPKRHELRVHADGTASVKTAGARFASKARRIYASETQAEIVHDDGRVTVMAGQDGAVYLIEGRENGTVVMQFELPKRSR